MERRVLFPGSLLLWLSLQACNCHNTRQLTVLNADNAEVSIQNGLAIRKGAPFTGILFIPNTNGKDTLERLSFSEGRENGVWKKWDNDGRLMQIREFSNGIKTGRYLAWWPNGAKKLDYRFKDGEYNGICKEWTDKGILIAKMTYRDGYETGRQIQFYMDGTVKANYVVANGRRYGLLGTKNCVNVADDILF